MREQIVSFKIAKLAKDIGFNIITKWFYNSDNPLSFNIELLELGYWTTEFIGKQEDSSYKFGLSVNAPTHSLLRKYFREKHNYDMNVEPIIIDEKHLYFANIYYREGEENKDDDFEEKDLFDTYEEAEADGLLEILTLLKKKTMTKEEMAENNELIADYMGLPNDDLYKDSYADYYSENLHLFNDEYYDYKTIKFNESWDLLMPVVHKIALKNYETKETGILRLPSWYFGSIGLYSQIEVVYKAVVKYIKWYNKKEKDEK